jgi:hypothetical protein
VRRFEPASLYPFLWATVPVLYRVERSPGYTGLGDLFIVLGAVLAIVGAVYAVAWLAFRHRAEGRLPALCAGLAVVWLFVFDPVARRLPRAPHHLSFAILGVVGVVATVLLISRLGRRPRLLQGMTTFLAVAGTLLVLRFAVVIARDLMRGRDEVAHSALARGLARPIPGPPRVPGPARNVYLIVLDEYANADALRTVFGFDNTPFLDSLRALGFHVPASVGSNYAHTTLSLPSLLNAAHVYPAAREIPDGSTDPSLMNFLLARNRVARFFQARGYRYVVFPSSWWRATRSNPFADSVVQVSSGFDLDRELTGSEFRRVLRRQTILDYVHRDEPWDGEFVRRTLEGVGRLPSVHGPVFAFAHVLNPHWPYVFDRSCRTPPRGQGLDPKASYIGQLQCLNGLVLATVTRLLRDSEVPPVILLQGDHGSAMRAHGIETGRPLRVEGVPAGPAWERFSAFGAYYLPDGGAEAFGDTVTVVNVMGNVLRRYFGAELPREPDDRYLSLEPAPFRFLLVDPVWLAGGREPLPPLHRAEAHR